MRAATAIDRIERALSRRLKFTGQPTHGITFSTRWQVRHSKVRSSKPRAPGEIRANPILCLHVGHNGRSVMRITAPKGGAGEEVRTPNTKRNDPPFWFAARIMLQRR